jgi:hypothetical protein
MLILSNDESANLTHILHTEVTKLVDMAEKAANENNHVIAFRHMKEAYHLQRLLDRL